MDLSWCHPARRWHWSSHRLGQDHAHRARRAPVRPAEQTPDLKCARVVAEPWSHPRRPRPSYVRIHRKDCAVVGSSKDPRHSGGRHMISANPTSTPPGAFRGTDRRRHLRAGPARGRPPRHREAHPRPRSELLRLRRRSTHGTRGVGHLRPHVPRRLWGRREHAKAWLTQMQRNTPATSPASSPDSNLRRQRVDLVWRPSGR
jgi:hypothetical protein